MDNINIILASNIYKYRKKCGLTQEALAEKVGVSFQSVSKWETAKSAPDVALLPMMADIFGVTVDYLLKAHTDEELSEDTKAEEAVLLFEVPRFESLQFAGNRENQVRVFMGTDGQRCGKIGIIELLCHFCRFRKVQCKAALAAAAPFGRLFQSGNGCQIRIVIPVCYCQIQVIPPGQKVYSIESPVEFGQSIDVVIDKKQSDFSAGRQQSFQTA